MNVVIVILLVSVMALFGYFRTRHIVNKFNEKGEEHDKKSGK